MVSAASVCLFVYQRDNFRISKRRTMKLGIGHCTKSRPSSNLGVITPLGAHPQQAFGYDVEKISTGCSV